MKIFSILVVKDEADIIQYSIEKALAWSDYIFIVENMSTDGTWELISKLYHNHPKIKIWGRYGGEFTETIRQIAFNQFESMLQYGDWICRLDADEEYIDDPKIFLSQLPTKCDHVNNISFHYYFTEKDYENEINTGDTSWHEGKLKHYHAHHSEIRFIKYCNYTYWQQNRGWPHTLLHPAEIAIRLKHYQYRNISQIKRRLQIRIQESSNDYFAHEKADRRIMYKKLFNYDPTDFELKNLIVPSHFLLLDTGEYKMYKNTIPSPPLKSRIFMRIRSSIYNIIFKKLNIYTGKTIS